MSAAKMHENQISTDVALVRRLLKSQFPAWSDLPVEPIVSDGTTNAIYRLGDELAVRLPFRPGGNEQLDKEHAWLPRFAPHLPLALPVPRGKGEPGDGYPCAWSVCEWIEGENPTLDSLADASKSAATLARFIEALQQIDAAAGPAPGDHNFWRGVPLADRDVQTRESIAGCEGLIDTGAALNAWQVDLRAPVWDAPLVWVHGDLSPGNLLSRNGDFTAVIDWGGLGVGDPAIELLPAWNLFAGETREAFRVALAVDDATWARGRGLAISQAVVALTYYRDTNPAIVRWANRMISEVLADHDSR
jgi:aminoglycoside phosphotransferase (APT) family kinase protein